ncbi:hypothetical protein LCGC14_2497060 [marine sediment metagenome]|uniref:Uncharacterized protein n=1 Tax=marine sediment metagenome TaxID=412755 RepID=A0A0F9DET1_9ZZZZ
MYLNYEDVRVWWIPQVPMKPFYVPVKNTEEAIKILEVLAQYDLFQYVNNIKPDYSNAGGLQVMIQGEWEEWEDGEGKNIDILVEAL